MSINTLQTATSDWLTPIEVTLDEFLGAMFPADLMTINDEILLTCPIDREGKSYYMSCFWRPGSSLSLLPGSWCYCISTVYYTTMSRRRLEDVIRTFVLPLDDIGTKAKEPLLEPNYVLETSPGNYQWGYLLDPIEYADDPDAVDTALFSLAIAGFNDIGCRGANRVMKLPGAIHKSGFKTRCVHWNPGQRRSLSQIMELIGVEPQQRSYARLRTRKITKVNLDDVKDPVLDWLVNTNRIQNINNRGWVEIECPWSDTHTDDPNGAGYSPLDYGYEGRSFHCFHESCQDRKWIDFLRWVIRLGGPNLNY